MTTIQDDHQQEQKQHECFLCTLDPNSSSCHQAQLEGRIVAAREHIFQSQKVAVMTLDTGAARIEVLLTAHYYRSLVQELNARPHLLKQDQLTLRVYHLPTELVVFQANGRTRSYYTTCDYTLAVLEPDVLLNITDLNQAEYCARQYMLNRLLPSAPSPATIRGNIIHYAFKELLKNGVQEKDALATLQQHLEQALEVNSIDMALTNISPEIIRAEALPHLESLAFWYEREHNTLWNMPTTAAQNEQAFNAGNSVRAETFLLAPEIGLRGRLDIFWQQFGQQRLLELKTGAAGHSLPKRDHRWQVLGYHALLAVRRDSQMKRALATLLYSGTPGCAQAFGIPANIREIQRVNEIRNILVLSKITGIPTKPPGPSRCSKCAVLEHCREVSTILQWQPPQPDKIVEEPALAGKSRDPLQRVRDVNQPVCDISDSDLRICGSDYCAKQDQHAHDMMDFLAKYYALLQMEERYHEEQQSLLWKLSVAERIEQGSAISGLEMIGEPIPDKDGWLIVFRCDNISELREGDEILLSDGNPVSGEVVTGTILAINSQEVTAWTRELIAHPMLIDRYDNDIVHVRTLQNLSRWQQATIHQQQLVMGTLRPRFLSNPVPPRPDFNTEQNLAVERALQMQDYLLIHGPPGTGKTSVIAEIVQRLVQQGQRVMLVAFTNQAVDNMLKRLDKEGFHHYLRLGHERSVAKSIQPHLLKELVTVRIDEQDSSFLYEDIVQDILYHTPVVASTTATWSSDKYGVHMGDNPQQCQGLSFDVAIIDEAGQLTVPAILGALRLAKRFILVGDEKQLPPLVLSPEAAEAGLADSLFSSLKQLDEQYTQEHPLATSACVPLYTQYRMNKWIADFPSNIFYDGKLVAHPSIADRCLVYKNSITIDDLIMSNILNPHNPFVFLDIHDEEDQPIASKQSHAEARAVRDIVAHLLERGIEMQDIGIIAPYRAQVANIRRHLFSADPTNNWLGLPSNAPISVDTVDRFQGGERLIIIISFATTYKPSIDSQRYTFLTNPHRLNVALTRAQCKLILLGCASALEQLPIFNHLVKTV